DAAATPQTPATPAPVDTPDPKAFAAAGTPATTPATATATAPTTPAATPAAPAPAPKPPVSFEYQTLTVEQILNKFQQQLETDALAFAEEAKRVCEYDAVLRDSQTDVARLTSETQRLMLEQEQIEKNIEGIDAFQNEIDRTLGQVEQQVDQILQNQSHLAPQDADLERERAYETAKNIDHRLEEMKGSLEATFDHLSKSNEQSFTGETGQIVTILNQHQDKIAELETTALKLQTDSVELTRMLQRSHQ
ncbi:MAG: hypothetical protein SGILL_005811, partial [Bacillariaceae sp.]